MRPRWYLDSAVVNGRVAYGVAVVAAGAAAYEAFALAALVLGHASSAVAPLAPRHAAPHTVSAPAIEIAAAHLFGVVAANSQPGAVADGAVTVPDTTLDMKLTGLLFGGEPHRRAAIIASGGRERTYEVGEEIDGTGGATVREVLADGVLFERQGATEMLRLVRFSGAGPRVAPSGDEAAARLARSTHPHSNDYLRLMRKTEDGRQIGFAVMPGRNREVFDVLGLQSNDVVTGIDGVALAERGGDSQLLERLERGGSLTLTVLRAGAPQEVHVDANRLPAGG